ncbi:glycosyltransferase [Amycolatopsis magusensis]|uniref:glycosyltransferase n=1 Tax=Amycolatopsis magusensis TaxID=882444 RepID=UPI0037B97CBA
MIGYYAHHLGAGHVHRASAIASRMQSPVVGFSTSPAPPNWAGRWITLPDDSEMSSPAADVTAAGTLHWVPLHHKGLRTRMGLVGAELAGGDIKVLVSDVSVEVAVFTRLHGIPVVVMAQPGDRDDPGHRLSYDLAEILLAPWPASAPSEWPRKWLDKTVHLGAVSRFDGRPAPGLSNRRRVLSLWGCGGLDVTADNIKTAAAETPDWQWEVIGPPVPGATDAPNLVWRGWVTDVWAELERADVIVTHAGQNAIAEVAAARRPAVVIPQARPHGEQQATAEALNDARIGVVVRAWPEPGAWPSLLTMAEAQGGEDWAAWSTGGGASEAAKVLDDLGSR